MQRMMRKKRVLFLCTGNSSRSQMAEGFLRNMLGDRFDAFSAGTKPADGVHPLAVKAMSEAGVDISRQRPKPIDAFSGQHFDRVITVCDSARDSCPFFPGEARQVHWSFDDPARAAGSEAEKLAVFRRVRDEIKRRISACLASPEDKDISAGRIPITPKIK